jgi:cytochrome oxidase Cu insertion factor (SCO1/SenC/PrrC family)/thiol-disulfide isomerase/thioredoxin
VLRRLPLVLLALFAGAIALDAAIALHRASQPAGAPAAEAAPLPVGTELDRPLPALPLIDPQGRRTSLARFRGSYLVLAPFMTECRETCPMTTAALEEIRRATPGRRVAVVEASVDPWRDTPARLRAYARRTGTDVTLLTGTHAQLRRLWRFFGVGFRWVDGDVEHTDGVFLVDPRGRLRVVVVGTPDVGGRLPARLRSLLDAQGRRNLRDPQQPWRATDVLADLRRLQGLPAAAAATPPATPGVSGGPLLAGVDAAALRARLKGRPAVVNAWASWCDPCRGEFPILAAVAAAYRGRVAFAGLDVSDKPGAARGFLKTHPLGYPSYSDDGGGLARSLAPLQGLPTTYFLDARGRLTYVHTGPYTSAADLRRDVERALA